MELGAHGVTFVGTVQKRPGDAVADANIDELKLVLGHFPSSVQLPVCPQDMPSERHLQNFDWTFGDHHAALVAPEFLDWQVSCQSHTAVNLQASIGCVE